MKHFLLSPIGGAVLLGCCASVAAYAMPLTPFSTSAAGAPPAAWRSTGLPERYAIPVTQFAIADEGGERVLRVKAERSWGSLTHRLEPPLAVSGATTLQWRWRLDRPLQRAALADKATEDAALKVCLAFALPTDRIPAGERVLFRLAQAFSDDPLPTATVCYLWAKHEALGHTLASPVTNRVRYIVLANAGTPDRTWLTHERHIGADFLRVFGHETSVIPPLVAVLIGADSDNTADSSLGWVGDLQLVPTP